MYFQNLSKLTENSVYFGENKITTFLFGIVILVLVRYIIGKWNRRKLPPGPSGIPVLGYYPFLGKEPEKKLNELGKKYGNVFGLYLGPQYMVFLNDWEATKDAMGQSGSSNRPPAVFAEVPYKFGFAGANGAEWLEGRRLTSKVMKDIGLHSARLEELIQEEVSDIVKSIIEHGEAPVDVRSFLCESFANDIITLLLGERLKHGHPIIKGVTNAVDAIIEYSPTICMINYSKTLSKVLQILGLEKKFLLPEKVHEFGKFVSRTVDERIQNPDLKTEDSFIAHFFSEIENNRKNKIKSYHTEDSLKGAVISLIVGGSETSRTTVIWLLMAMADHPDKQQKVHEELDRVIGRDGSIRWSDRLKIPYTHATIMETMRWATVVPLSSLRIAADDMYVQGYFIPKGTFLSANTWAMHNDPRYWDKPEEFIPERFLLKDGKVNTNPDSYNPFSYGKRNCPGKLIAHVEILQYFTILMQNFKVLPKEGNKVKYDPLLGLTYQATNVELRFIKR